MILCWWRRQWLSNRCSNLLICLLSIWDCTIACAVLPFVFKLVVTLVLGCWLRRYLVFLRWESFSVFFVLIVEAETLLCECISEEESQLSGASVLMAEKYRFVDAFTMSDLMLLSEDELAIMSEAVSSWCLLHCSFFNSRLDLQSWANCCVRGSVTALICLATTSYVTDTLEVFWLSRFDILTGAFAM